MATGDTAPAPLTIPPPPIEPLSDDDGSSPLSDVEDKDADPDGMHGLNSATPNNRDEDLSSPDDLSDANDTEAETERLYDTPRNPTRHKDIVLSRQTDGHIYERASSKLRRHITRSGEDKDRDDAPLFEEEMSIASSPPAQETKTPNKNQSPILGILAEAASQEAESRKRKRSLPAVTSVPPQLTRKRTGSVPTPSRQDMDGDTPMIDEEDPSLHTNSGEHSLDEANNVVAGEDDGDDHAQGNQSDSETVPKKQTRSGSKKLKAVEQPTGTDEHEEGAAVAAIAEDGAHAAEDEQAEADVDEEAEAAHRNEEELERKRTAFDQLSAIEKRFATFRDRLYEERLEALNREEAMLRSDNPTHPEYLAMMECIDARRDERIRVANRELELNKEALDRWAVARRSQIHSQYFQSVRESRETILAELGQQWYDIQHERRKQANNVPEFGLRFPSDPTQRIKNALAYNKEVSILSGIAKHEGMPAAPDMKGATLQELDDDFDAMNRNRQAAPRHHVHRPSYVDYGGLPFGQSLGPAGEQFIEQTPWANPNHPSNAHLLQRQHSGQNEAHTQGAAPNAPSGSKKSSHPSRPFSNGSTTQPSSNPSKTQKGVPRQLSNSPEVTRAATLLEQTKARSMRAAETAARHENGQSVSSL
ncbi:Sds3-like-domain-containing protein [Annulohypoxylon maeteangense]|uniref:Sds3-like-domain-containing protein n=1 Tax=Annulohypoxylon maeteangense TaxID=1927788 RepID=UPI0020079D1B|nr:Sds3-like-domain-containing protein [Annulohypoxylon maeteangense]KAI0889249.1 Sds3-like-domain-containing protein [Annulohypoxylon maeteangense]